MQASERSSRRADAVLALVVAPTRELAKQLYDSFRKHSYGTVWFLERSYLRLKRPMWTS